MSTLEKHRKTAAVHAYWLDVSMHKALFMNVCNSTDDLSKEKTSFILRKSVILNNVVKQFTSRTILEVHNNIQCTITILIIII